MPRYVRAVRACVRSVGRPVSASVFMPCVSVRARVYDNVISSPPTTHTRPPPYVFRTRRFRGGVLFRRVLTPTTVRPGTGVSRALPRFAVVVGLTRARHGAGGESPSLRRFRPCALVCACRRVCVRVLSRAHTVCPSRRAINTVRPPSSPRAPCAAAAALRRRRRRRVALRGSVTRAPL